ncbi:MAG: AMP-binding protein, partial [Planctomycetota bacterium]|nr:AMP-binding protein [Planctomycetota bacterium]
ELERMDRNSLVSYQLERLNALLDQILPGNRFYAEKLADIPRPVQSLDDLVGLPFTEKSELAGATEDGWAVNRTFPRRDYVRLHQTSGTKGRPLVVMDTPEDWHWWIDSWQYVLDAAELTTDDVCIMAFSFGPFIGFWSAFDAAAARGCLVIPGGGLSTVARLDRMYVSGATCLFCTPSYALHMAEVAAENNVDIAASPIRCLILAGEPGASVLSIRERIEQAWQAKVLDHSGASEIGPWGYGNLDEPGLHVNEAEFIAEFLSLDTGGPAADGEVAELVLTTLGRAGSPVIRYRTGDRVRPDRRHDREVRFVWLDKGLLGRADDMMIIRGINIFPSSIEQILRSFPEVVEYRMTASKEGEMDQLTIEVEDRRGNPQRVADELQLRLGLRIDVRDVAAGSLPRFEAKGKRFIDNR